MMNFSMNLSMDFSICSMQKLSHFVYWCKIDFRLLYKQGYLEGKVHTISLICTNYTGNIIKTEFLFEQQAPVSINTRKGQ